MMVSSAAFERLGALGHGHRGSSLVLAVATFALVRYQRCLTGLVRACVVALLDTTALLPRGPARARDHPEPVSEDDATIPIAHVVSESTLAGADCPADAPPSSSSGRPPGTTTTTTSTTTAATEGPASSEPAPAARSSSGSHAAHGGTTTASPPPEAAALRSPASGNEHPPPATSRVVSLRAEGCERLVALLRAQRATSWSPDVLIDAGGRRFSAHACVLEATSPVLAEAARRARKRQLDRSAQLQQSSSATGTTALTAAPKPPRSPRGGASSSSSSSSGGRDVSTTTTTTTTPPQSGLATAATPRRPRSPRPPPGTTSVATTTSLSTADAESTTTTTTTTRSSGSSRPPKEAARPPPERLADHPILAERRPALIEMSFDGASAAVDAAALGLVLDFAYGALVTLTESNVESLLELASKLRIGPLVDECCAFVAQRASAPRACRVLALADKHKCTFLRRDVALLVLRRFEAAAGLDEDPPVGKACHTLKAAKAFAAGAAVELAPPFEPTTMPRVGWAPNMPRSARSQSDTPASSSSSSSETGSSSSGTARAAVPRRADAASLPTSTSAERAEARRGFLALPRHLLEELLSDDRLCVADEAVVFRAAVAWIDHRVGDLTRDDVDAVLALVRFYLISAEFLADAVEPHPLMQSRACQDLVHAAYRYQALPPDRRAVQLLEHNNKALLKPPPPPKQQQHANAQGGLLSAAASSSAHGDDPDGAAAADGCVSSSATPPPEPAGASDDTTASVGARSSSSTTTTTPRVVDPRRQSENPFLPLRDDDEDDVSPIGGRRPSHHARWGAVERDHRDRARRLDAAPAADDPREQTAFV